MQFKDALDNIGLSASEAGELFGLTGQTVRQMRMDPDAAGYRSPPDGWVKILAAYARTRGKEMGKIAERLERDG